MANKPLVSVRFPGLDPKYTVPQIDNTLSAAGKAADAKKTGDEITELKQDYNQVSDLLIETKTKNIPCSFTSALNKAKLTLSNYSDKRVFISNRNLLPQFPATTDHGITCVQNSDGSISLSGTADGAASFRMSANMIPNLSNGTFKIILGNGNVTIGDDITYINASINDAWSGTVSARLDTPNSTYTFTLTENDVMDGIRLRISNGVVIPDGYKIYPMIVEVGQEETFIAHDGTILLPTESVNDIDVFTEYTYVSAMTGVSGSVEFGVSNLAELDARITALEDLNALAGKKIVCFGDSITGNYQPPTDYPTILSKITGATVYNAGFGGCCMSDNHLTDASQTRYLFTMCRLADSIVGGTGNYGDFTAQRNSGVSITYSGTSIDYVPTRLTMLEGIDWSEIDYITIAYGTNDWNSNYGLDNANDPDDTSTYIGAFRYAVETILSKFHNIKILAITPLWRWWDTNSGMPSGETGDYLDANTYAKGTGYYLWNYGNALIEAAKWYHIPVLDMYFNCMMNKQNRFQYFNTTDGTHPKLEGRIIFAEILRSALESKY